nr:vegetative cell wall protein gp1-like [Lolium perenne]
MGRTHTSRPDAPSASTNPQVLDHATPLQAEVGREFLEKLTSQGKKKKAPTSEAGPSEAPPAKRPRQEVVGGKTVSKKQYKKRQMPPYAQDLQERQRHEAGELRGNRKDLTSSSLKPGTSSAGSAAPTPPDHRAEEDHVSPPETQDTGASNIGADSEAAGGGEPQVPPVPKRKKKKTADSSPSKTVPDSSAPAGSTSGQDAPDARSPPETTPAPPPEAPTCEPTGAKPTPPSKGPTAAELMPPPSQGPAAAKPPPPPEGTKPLKPEPSKAKATASGTPTSGPHPLVLHVGRAAVVAGETASGQLGQITELTRGGNELGHLLEYAEKWNRADVSTATRGLGKDRLPTIDPAGP